MTYAQGKAIAKQLGLLNQPKVVDIDEMLKFQKDRKRFQTLRQSEMTVREIKQYTKWTTSYVKQLDR